MLAALAFAMDLAGTLAVSDRSEIRARAPGAIQGAASLDAETALKLALTLGTRSVRVSIGYSPRLTVWNAGTSWSQVTLAHTAQARAEWIGRRARLSLEEVGSYGGVNLAAAGIAPDAEGQPTRVDFVPSTQVLNVLASTTTLAATYTTRRWTFASRAGYQISGGADAGSRSLLPLQSGPFGEVSAEHALSRADRALASVSAAETSFTSGAEVLLVDAALGVRRRLARTADAWIKAGLSEVHARVPLLVAPGFATYPVVEAGLERRALGASPVSARAGARLGPVVNRLTGTVDERLQVTLAASYERARITTAGSFALSCSIPAGGPEAATVIGGELGAGYGVTERVTFDAGARGLWQRFGATGSTLSQGMLFLGVTLRAPTVRL
jgi:hypothetical protein